MMTKQRNGIGVRLGAYGFLRMMAAIVLAAMLVVSLAPQPVSAATTADDQVVIDGTINYDYAKQVLTLVNEQRVANGEAELSLDAKLTEAAMTRAAECALYFSHARPNGTSCFTISSKAVAENIAAGSSTPTGVMNQWMNSSGHKANILGSSYKSIGIGCFKQGNIYYWVQIFGTSSASGTVSDGTTTGSYTVDVDYDTVSLDFAFNLNASPSDPEELEFGESYKLKACVINAGWTYVYASLNPSCLTWTSSDTSVCTVSASGVVTAGSKAGTATVTATTKGGKSCSQNFKVIVSESSTTSNTGSTNTTSTTKNTTTTNNTGTTTTTTTTNEDVASQAMYRLYNPNSGEHFYTASTTERDNLVSVGWNYEGVAWNAPESGTPVYRLYNPNAGDHHYTMSGEERDNLTSIGWSYEGIGWYSAGDSGQVLYRLYNPNAVAAGAHHYTGSATERDNLVSLGWNYEGIGWYGVK